MTPVAGPLSILRLFDSPLRVFRSRLEREPDWLLAAAPVVVHLGIAVATVLVVARKTRRATTPVLVATGVAERLPPLVGELIAVVSVVTAHVAILALSAITLVGSDLLLVQSGRARRLVELCGLSYLTQLPLGVTALAICLWGWDPEPFRVPSGTTMAELPDHLRRYREAMAAGAVQSSLRLLGAYFGVWLVALQCAALRVVSGVSLPVATAVGLGLVMLLVVAPLGCSSPW